MFSTMWLLMPIGYPMGREEPEETGRGKLTAIAAVAVPVSDLEEAVPVYTEVFGMTIVNDMRALNWVELSTAEGGARLALYVPGPDDRRQPGIPTGVVFSTDSIYDFHKVMVDEGVVFTLKPERDKSGRLIARFEDGDGNEFEVMDAPPNKHVDR